MITINRDSVTYKVKAKVINKIKHTFISVKTVGMKRQNFTLRCGYWFHRESQSVPPMEIIEALDSVIVGLL